jgi:hypothetical protein
LSRSSGRADPLEPCVLQPWPPASDTGYAATRCALRGTVDGDPTRFLGYFDTNGASNGGTEAVNGLIELHRRIARGFRNRDNYRLRMLLIAGGLRP